MVKAQSFDFRDDAFCHALRAARRVEILNAQQKPASPGAGAQPGACEGDKRAEMERPAGGGGEAGYVHGADMTMPALSEAGMERQALISLRAAFP